MRYDNILDLPRGRLRTCPRCRRVIDHLIMTTWAKIQLAYDGRRLDFIEMIEADTETLRAFCPECRMPLEMAEVVV